MLTVKSTSASRSDFAECVCSPIAVSVILVAHTSLIAWAAWQRAPVHDEPAHVAAGISHWYHGRFELYRANPPLTRMIGALPLVIGRIDGEWLGYSSTLDVRMEFCNGRAFLQRFEEHSFWLITFARWACIPLSLVGGCVCYWWGRELYGPAAGLIAAALWCFSPNILTHAAHVTPDAAAAALGVTAGYLFWQWLRQPRWRRALIAGIGLGLAELTKLTWLILFVLWPLLWVATRGLRNDCRRVSEAVQMAGILLCGLFILNLAYGFQGTLRPLADYDFVSETLAGSGTEQANQTGNRFRESWLGRLPVPLPSDYVLGIDRVKEAFELKRLAYVGGEFTNGGWWYYYLYGLAVKVPLGTWLLVGLSCYVACRQSHGCNWTDTCILLAAPILIVILASINSDLNRHLRYILPAFPFAFIWAGRWAREFEARNRPIIVLGCVALGWSVTSSLSVYPHSTAYFNELAGGPENGHAHLICSNIDWGQDLLNLKKWMDEHPEAKSMTLAYYGPADPRLAGIRSAGLPPHLAEGRTGAERGPGPQPGWHAISVHILRGSPTRVYDAEGNLVPLGFGWYQYFLQTRPVASIGYSIHVYHLTLAEANRIRRNLRLPALPAGKERRPTAD